MNQSFSVDLRSNQVLANYVPHSTTSKILTNIFLTDHYLGKINIHQIWEVEAWSSALYPQSRSCTSLWVWAPDGIQILCSPQNVISMAEMLQSYHSYIWVNQGILKGESGLFLTPVLTLWGSGHIDHHIWRWNIVPSDLTQSFGTICAHYRYRVIHRRITFMHVWFKSTRERQLML